MASVHRYRIRFDIRKSPDEPPGPDFNDFVLASDYDKLVEVCREILGNIDCTHVTLGKKRRELKAKALALLGEKEN